LGKRGRFSRVSERENAEGAGPPESGGQVSPADKPLKTPAREPPNERKGASGLFGDRYRIEVRTGCYGNGRGMGIFSSFPGLPAWSFQEVRDGGVLPPPPISRFYKREPGFPPSLTPLK